MLIHYSTLGCKLNFAETSEIAKQLRAYGHATVRGSEKADVCVVNTCSVTDVADQKGRQLIRRLHREYPEAILIVTGCYAQLRPDEVAAIEGVDYVVGANDKPHIMDLVEQLSTGMHPEKGRWVTDLMAPMGRLSEAGLTFHPSVSKDDRTRCFLKVQDGCDYYCTYCTIPMARGKSRNASIADTVAMAQQAIDEGAREIVLTGVNIGDFGRSTSETFIDLCRALDEVTGEVRYRISSCEPNLLSDELIELVAHSRHFAPHFHLPLQSGSDEVLRIMKRRYNRDLFRERVEHIRRVMPSAFIGVDCMVGVRGETLELFDDYVRFITDLDVQQLHVFPYSERRGTRMVEMDLPRVDKNEQKRRVEVLMRISDEKLKQFYQQHAHDAAVVLWEAKREKAADGSMMMAGWTENYRRVTRPYEASLVNTFQAI